MIGCPLSGMGPYNGRLQNLLRRFRVFDCIGSPVSEQFAMLVSVLGVLFGMYALLIVWLKGEGDG